MVSQSPAKASNLRVVWVRVPVAPLKQRSTIYLEICSIGKVIISKWGSYAKVEDLDSEEDHPAYLDIRLGRIAWSSAPVLKTGDLKGSVGSNPTPTVKGTYSEFLLGKIQLNWQSIQLIIIMQLVQIQQFYLLCLVMEDQLSRQSNWLLTNGSQVRALHLPLRLTQQIIKNKTDTSSICGEIDVPFNIITMDLINGVIKQAIPLKLNESCF